MNKGTLGSRLITLWRAARAGARNFIRNGWLNTAATAVMTVTLTLILTAVILNLALNDTLKDVTQKIDIAIFFEENVSQQDIDTLDNELKSMPNVASTAYVSKSEALARYREQNRDNLELLEAVTDAENPLPRSLEVRVRDLDDISAIVAITETENYRDLIQDTNFEEDRRKTIERIGSFKAFLTRAGIFASSVFAVIAILIIFNTIRIAIFSRREELEIMRLIGATNGFIRGPFIFEAMLDGLIAAVITLILAYGLIFGAGPKLLAYVNFSATLAFFEQYWTLTALLTIMLGLLIGVLSSRLAMARYLKL